MKTHILSERVDLSFAIDLNTTSKLTRYLTQINRNSIELDTKYEVLYKIIKCDLNR